LPPQSARALIDQLLKEVADKSQSSGSWLQREMKEAMAKLPTLKEQLGKPFVANARHIKNVPGRKTDMNDAMWIADLVSFGLIKASFVPEQEMQELRSLLRARKQLTREQTSHVQRIQRT
jgi:Transposase